MYNVYCIFPTVCLPFVIRCRSRGNNYLFNYEYFCKLIKLSWHLKAFFNVSKNNWLYKFTDKDTVVFLYTIWSYIMCCASEQLHNCYFESSKHVLQGFRLPMRAGQQACMDRLHTSGDVGTPVLLNTALWHMILLVDIFYILIVKKNHSFIFPLYVK